MFQKLAQKGSYLKGGKDIKATLQKMSFSHKHVFAGIFLLWKIFWFFRLESEMFSLTSTDLGGFLKKERKKRYHFFIPFPQTC